MFILCLLTVDILQTKLYFIIITVLLKLLVSLLIYAAYLRLVTFSEGQKTFAAQTQKEGMPTASNFSNLLTVKSSERLTG